jgi:nucleoside-diphosphate-sugar epimerase
MSVLVTGAGMVGCQIALQLLERAEEPILFDISPSMDNIDSIVGQGRAKVIRGNVLEPIDLVKVIIQENVDRVIHTATLFGLTRGVQENPYDGIKLNIMGTANVLEVARVLGLKRVVLTSTGAVYIGTPLPPDQPVDEDIALRCISGRTASIYGITKLAGELLGLNYSDHYGVDFVAVRFGSVFGPWKGPASGRMGMIIGQVVETLLNAASGRVTLQARWSGEADIVYSKDAARGTVLACFAPNPQSRIYNIALGRGSTFSEVAEVLGRLFPHLEIRVDESVAAGAPPGLPAPDISRARQELGYEPDYPIEVALQDYVQWVKGS